MQINTATDITMAAAIALAKRDGSAFDELIHINQSWMQPADEGDARHAMLLTMQEAAYLLEGEATECDGVLTMASE